MLGSIKGQKSLRGRPYILHSLRAAEQMITDKEMAVAALHDVVEDTDTTLDDLVEYGFSGEVIDAVDLLTHRKSESYEDYIERVRGNEPARKVKLADLEDNMRIDRIPHTPKTDYEKVAARLLRYNRAKRRLLEV